MPFDASIAFGLFESLVTVLDRMRARGRSQELLEVRTALKALYFKDLTIDRLSSGNEISRRYVAITQRDTANDVQKSLDLLQEFSVKEGLSIEAERALQSIRDQKINLRKAIAQSLHGEDGGALVAKIQTLNALIEKIDQELGGHLL